ncbi:MAG: DUF3472 domain-containing protein [Clostridia bacterium]|nr:DUF3472 domain-containing protein [Clostridia bacterium]
MKKLTVILLTLCLACGCVPALASGAPYMVATVLDWDGQIYDIIEGQFKCVDRVPCTYYAMHNWYNGADGFTDITEGSGYAGFQYKDGQGWTIMSVWDTDKGRAAIEYAPANAVAQPFSGEGNGIQILVPYDWEPGVWYTMRIQALTEGNKTLYEQWIRPENGDWIRMAVISYSKPNLGFRWDCFFLEDWAGNGYLRSCQLRGYYARPRGGYRWSSLREYDIFTDDRSMHYSFARTDQRTVFIQSGGDCFPVLEVPETLTVLQASEPDWRYMIGH